MLSTLIKQLIDDLRCLPGVGPKSAQRMAFNILGRNRENGLTLAKSLQAAITQIKHCQRCRMFTELDLCELCQNTDRDSRTLCIIETPVDLMAMEQTGSFHGLYFVLMGHLSPLDGIGPKELGIEKLIHRLTMEPITELVIATNPTVEGEATAHYISSQANKLRGTGKLIACSRIAHGVPLGGELEYLDSGTLARAFNARTKIEAECPEN